MITKLQNMILEMIARGAPLGETIDTLCVSVEAIAPDVVCSVLRLSEDKKLRCLSGPSLPTHYTQAIDNLPIGPNVGSCGTAAYTGKDFLVTDIATHPNWEGFKELAASCGLVACWSSPIHESGVVVGTFAFYFRTSRAPTPLEEQIVQACTYLCAIALERNRQQTERRRLAQTDPLTQLWNRGRFNEVVHDLGDSRAEWGLMIADLDNLKLVNDRLGHGAGDELIREAARRIASVTPDGTSFRIGGDEFAIITEGGVDAMRKTAADILDAMKTSCVCAGQTLTLSITIGGAISAPGEEPERVRQKADYALYHAKERGRGMFTEYVPGLGSAIAKRFKSIQDLTEALQAGRIVPYYQPVINLAVGEITGLEALCRIQCADGSIIEASSFYEATQDGQAAAELTRLMLARAAEDARRWLDMGLDFGRVGINLSGADFCQDGLADKIAQVFAAQDVPLNKVILEVTESVYLDQRDQNIAQQISAMRSSGMAVALDDFGTGYASLTHLLSVPVDMIKIDRRFVQRMTTDSRGLVIIKGLLEIADGLGIAVIAEGIETIDQAGLLLKLGCLRGQGYLFSRAIDAHSITELLRTHGRKTPARKPDFATAAG